MSSDSPNENKTPEAPHRVVVRVDLDALPKTALDVQAKNSRSALAALMRNDLADTAKAINTLPAPFAENEMQRLLRETGVASLASTARQLADDAVRSSRDAALRAMQFSPPRSAQDEILRTLRGSEIFNTASFAKQMAMDVMGVAAQEAQRALSVSQQFSSQWLVRSAMSDTLRVAQSYAREIASLTETHRAMVERVNADVQKMWAAVRSIEPQEHAKALLRMPSRVKENLLALAQAGWYLDAEMPIGDVIYFKEELERVAPSEIDADLAVYFRKALDRIEQTLIENHPRRAHLIRDAFDAHRAGRYNAAIPLLFSQVDGVCYDLSGVYIFSGKGLSRLAKKLEPDALERAYLEPLLRSLPISEGIRRRETRSGGLNRHAVLHGESVDYGTEENSLRAISFLSFVSYAVRSLVDASAEAAQPHAPARISTDSMH